MRCEPWMNKDERTPDQIKRDRVRNLREVEVDLEKRLKDVRARIAEIIGA